ncbi:MAG: type II secretion system protein N [Pseudomonadota bacterium]
MIGWAARILLVLLVALVTMIMTVPMSVVADRAQGQVPGLGWAQAQGTIWSGRLSNIAYGPQAVGDVNLKLRPASLIQGRMSYYISLDGPVASGTSRAYVQRGVIGVAALDVTARLEQLVGLNATVRNAGGIARLSNVDVELNEHGCRSASGQLWTDSLVNLGQQYGEELPELAGGLGCDDGMLVLSLSGAEDNGIEVDIHLRVGVREPSRLEAEISGASGEIAQALNALGFTVDNGRFVYVRESSLAGSGG